MKPQPPPLFLSTCFEATSLQFYSYILGRSSLIPESTRWIISGSFSSILQNSSHAKLENYLRSGSLFLQLGAAGDHSFDDSFRGFAQHFNLAEIVSVMASLIKVRPFHSPPWPLLFLATSTHIYALSIQSLSSKGNVRKSISTAFDDGNESKAHDSLTIRS